jgi:hypothetical protein
MPIEAKLLIVIGLPYEACPLRPVDVVDGDGWIARCGVPVEAS